MVRLRRGRGGACHGLALAFALLGAAAGCDPECELARCDIRLQDCQLAIMRSLTCVRGGDPAPVPVRVVDADAYIAEQAASAGEAEDAAEQVRWYRGLALLALASEDLSAGEAEKVSLDNVAAFYSIEEKRVTVLDRGAPLDAFASTLLLVHEYVHALQDAEHDLAGLHEEHDFTFDGSLGMAAVIEGEAVLYADQAQVYASGFDLDDVDFARGFASFRSQSRAAAVESRDPILELRSNFVYGYGASYVYGAYRSGGAAAIDALFDDPPVSSRQVIAGYAAPPPGGEPWLEPELDAEALPVLPAPFELVGSAHLGSYALWVLLQRWLPASNPLAATLDPPAVQRLRADVLSVHDTPGGEAVVVVWRLRFASERDADSVAEGLQQGFRLNSRHTRAYMRAWSSSRDAFIVALHPGNALAEPLEQASWIALPEQPAPASASASARRVPAPRVN